MLRPLGLEQAGPDLGVIKFGSREMRMGASSAHPEIFRSRWDAFLVGRVYPHQKKSFSPTAFNRSNWCCVRLNFR